MLSEWCKYAINMHYDIPWIQEGLRNLFINYITTTDYTFNHYEKLINDVIEHDRESFTNCVVEDGAEKIHIPELKQPHEYKL